jgi:UDP-3-O-[3-hydroxymyristoyl] N-acetylglucosamine deacetylase
MFVPFEASGPGLHTGVRCKAGLAPGPAGSGTVFRTAAGEIPAVARHIDDSGVRATDLSCGRARVRTVEHLLAALAMSGLADVAVRIEGPEVPALDGCAAAWVELLARAEARSTLRGIEIAQPLELAVGGSRAEVVPVASDDLAVYSVHLDYPRSSVGEPAASFAPFVDDFARRIAPARTFALEREVPRLLAAGLGKGGDLDNALVLGDDGPLNPGGMRFANEPARHKLLDLIGDLFLAGGLPRAVVTAHRPGHALNHALARAIASARA